MTDNYINVTVTSKENKRVTVSTQDPGYEVTATTDTGKFWAQTAENWATSDTIVENKDYSSKYYANKAKISEENARVYEASVKETYNSLIAESSGISNEIRTTGNEVIDNINSTKTNILKDIEFVADGEKKEIEELAEDAKADIKSTGFYMRDDKLYFINSKGEEEEFKSGVEPETLEQFVKKDSLVEVQTVIETYVNGASWYRIWSDGWCEQGGYYIPTATTGTITLLKSYKDIDYSITTGGTRTSNDNMYMPTVGVTKTASSFSIYCGSTVYRIYWQACGYIW